MTIDATGLPTHACPICGHTFFKVKCHFSEYEIDFYDLTAECDSCGALVTVPCPLDDPEFVR